MEDASVPGHPFVHTVDSASSVEAEDLFNNMHRIVITKGRGAIFHCYFLRWPFGISKCYP